VELLAHSLNWLASVGENLSELSVTLQCDNNPRECKNNVMLAFFGELGFERQRVVEKLSFCWYFL
jgi:hypothetical protein